MREGQQKSEGLAKSQFSINMNIKWSNSLQTWRSNEENIDGTQRNQSLLIQTCTILTQITFRKSKPWNSKLFIMKVQNWITLFFLIMRVKWRTNLTMIHTKKAKQILNSYLYKIKKINFKKSFCAQLCQLVCIC